MAVEQTSTISWYLRMFSYLLMICGLFGLAVGGVAIYGAFADGAATTTGLPLSALVLGVTAAVANGITIAAGVLGRAASRNPGRAAALRSLALAGVVASVFGLAVLCHGRSASHVAHLQPVAHGDLRRHRRQPGEIGPIVRPLP